jgi:hypothetical protein
MRSRSDTRRLLVLAAIMMRLLQLPLARSRWWRLRITLILCVLGGAFAAGVTAPPALAGVGTCPASESALQTAITDAGANGTVFLSCATATTISFSPSGTGSTGIAGTGPITINQSVTLDASGSPAPITFDGHSDSQLFLVNSGVIFGLSVLTLANGLTATGDGGAINNAGTLTVTSSTFSGNSAPGGAIFSSGSLTVISSTFSGNSALEAGGGGAIFISSGSLTVTNSTFSGNLAPDGSGGAIFNGGTSTVTNSTFSDNSAPGKTTDGGAISNSANFSSSATLTVANSTFSGNSASGQNDLFGTDQGGAISNSAGLIVTNSTFSGNSVGFGSGGAIFNSGSSTVTNSTFSGNSASSGSGGTIFNDGGAPLGAFGGAIIANSTSGGNCSGTGAITDNGYNLTDDGTCGFTGTGDLQNTNPQLGALANNGGPTQTMALAVGSPASDAIPTGYDLPSTTMHLCPTTDQRGSPRPDGSAETSCDIGAYEASSATTVARVASFGVLRVRTVIGSRLEFRWRLPQAGRVVGFNLYAGTHRLNSRTIPVHAAAGYRYDVHWSGHGPYRLQTLLAKGGSVRTSAP